MAEFMGHDAGHFFAAEHREQAGGRGHGGVLRIAAGGEGVGSVRIDQVDARHRQAGALCKLGDEAIELRRAAFINFTRIVHPQDDTVGIPVREQVHACRHKQCNDRTALAAKHEAECHEQRRQCRQQHGRLDTVHFYAISSARPRYKFRVRHLRFNGGAGSSRAALGSIGRSR